MKMKRVSFLLLALTLILSLFSSAPAFAQDAQPPVRPTGRVFSQPPPLPPINWVDDGVKPTRSGNAVATSDLGAQAVSIGASGTSFRPTMMVGVTGEPYAADGYHVYTPHGMKINGNDLYVVEMNGGRLLKFDLSSPENATLILGHAGVLWHHDDYLASPRDVAVDASGNIWVAMNTAVKKFDQDGTFLLTIPESEPWMTGLEDYRFEDINGIEVGPDGFLYVVDRSNHRIQMYDISGIDPVYYATIGDGGNPHDDNEGFYYPNDIAFDSADRMYVLDGDNFRIQRCEATNQWDEWECETAFGEVGVIGDDLEHLSWNNGFTIDGDDLFIADGGNGRILKCDTTSASPIPCVLYVDTSISSEADFNWNADVAVDSAGNVYVSDFHNHRIQVFDSDAIYQDTIGVPGEPYAVDTERYNNPWGIATAADGSIYVMENRGYRLIKLNAAGVQQWTIGTAGKWGDDNDHFGSWWGGLEGSPAVDAAGRVYVPDTGNHRVQIFNSDGSYFATLGEWGMGKYEFQCPAGVAIHPVNGDIYVVDRCNNRVQVFNSARVYKGTIGITGSAGQDSWRFDGLFGVAVDSSGNAYFADHNNNRVQKCKLISNGYSCSTFVGVENVFSEDYGHLKPIAVAVDSAGRVYIADEWNHRVQVFDSSGAYLTTIGSNWSSMSGGLTNPRGVAVDASGNVYVAEGETNFRIQKFSPGTPGWKQSNINGFGIRGNGAISSMAEFGGYLYAGTGGEGQLWRSADGVNWQPVMGNGFDGSGNYWITSLFVFDGQLYAGTYNEWGNGGQVWRSSNGTEWEPVTPDGYNQGKNLEVHYMSTYNGELYFSTWADTYGSAEGFELWKSPTGNWDDWTQVEYDGFGNANNASAVSILGFENHLYVSTFNFEDGVEIWRSADGESNWTQVNTSGFGNEENFNASLAAFGGYLYAVTGRSPGESSQIRRCEVCDGSDWEEMSDPFDANPNLNRRPGLLVLGNTMYLALGDWDAGLHVFGTTNGVDWAELASGGFGDLTNQSTYYSNSITAFNQQLYVGTFNWTNGGQVWRAITNANQSFTSIAAQDGWILETAETSNKGGTMNSGATTFQLGDDASNRQYRAILSFDTSSVPDHAVINSVTLKIKQNGKPKGKNPFSVLGGLVVDIRSGWFGSSASLVKTDFNAKASAAKVGTFGKTPSAGWYTVTLSNAGKSNLNKAGLTQFRLAFSKDDNNNFAADFMKFFSGNAAEADKPVLTVNYTLP